MIYEFIKLFGPELVSVKLKGINKTSLKSNHYWLMAIIPKLKNLKALTLYLSELSSITYDFFKFLNKALTYFAKNGGDLKYFGLHHFNQGNTQEYLYGCLKHMPNVEVLNFNSFALKISDAKAISKVLSDFKCVKELILNNAGLSTETIKEIADGVMRAKQLEIIRMANHS